MQLYNYDRNNRTVFMISDILGVSIYFVRYDICHYTSLSLTFKITAITLLMCTPNILCIDAVKKKTYL